MITETQIKQIIHQSRRGLKELDVILETFNQHHLKSLDKKRVKLYINLLKIEDHDLLKKLLKKSIQKRIINKL